MASLKKRQMNINYREPKEIGTLVNNQYEWDSHVVK